MFNRIKWCSADERILIDDDFQDKFIGNIWTAIVMQYQERKLNVGKNLALATIWYWSGHNIDIITNAQEEVCIIMFGEERWLKIAESRDKYLKILQVWS